MSRKSKKRRSASKGGLSWPDVANTAVTTCINKGQLPLILLLLIFLVICGRIPPDSLGTITELLVNHFIDLSLVGWLGLGALSVWHVISSRKLRKTLHDEIERVASKRDELQNEQSGQAHIESSRQIEVAQKTSAPHSKQSKERRSDGKPS